MKKPSSENIRVLKTDTCPTISNKGKLTYQLGCSPKEELFIRVTDNTGGGFFSNEWIAWNDIQVTLKKRPKHTPLTSVFLIPLFSGKSSNTSAFVLAAMRDLNLVQPMKDKKRCHELLDTKMFLEEMKDMMSSNVSRNVAKKRAAVKKAATNKVTKKTSSRKKKTVTKK